MWTKMKGECGKTGKKVDFYRKFALLNVDKNERRMWQNRKKCGHIHK